MIVDTSDIMPVLFREPEAQTMIDALGAAPSLAIAAPTLVEAALVSEGRAGPGMRAELDEFLQVIRPEIVPFTPDLVTIAQRGWRAYGKGNHLAALNLGDCFACALAKARDEPLPFKGADFARTDIRPAI
jgi:ribonuclease VapC